MSDRLVGLGGRLLTHHRNVVDGVDHQSVSGKVALRIIEDNFLGLKVGFSCRLRASEPSRLAIGRLFHFFARFTWLCRLASSTFDRGHISHSIASGSRKWDVFVNSRRYSNLRDRRVVLIAILNVQGRLYRAPSPLFPTDLGRAECYSLPIALGVWALGNTASPVAVRARQAGCAFFP